MKQESFSDMEYRCRKRKTKREEFLKIMDEIIPWNVHDISAAAKLPRENDEVVCGDSAYPGLEKRDEIKRDPQDTTINFRINSASTAGQADCPWVQTTPLTGSGVLRTANPLYAARRNTPAGL